MKHKPTPKQIAAIICIVLLVLLYVATLVVSLLDFPGSDRLFAACLLATIGLPILLWSFIWVYGRLTQKPTIAEIFPSPEIEGAGADMDTPANADAGTDDGLPD